jgi:tetratricopeptide (TPR) repeat protein
VYAALLEPEVFLLLFVIAFLYFVTSKDVRGQWSAGVALALSVSIRPSVLPLLAVVPFFFRVNERSTWLVSSKRVLLPSLAVLLALSARNGLATGSFSPLGMNPGFVFFEGNNPLSTGKSSVYPPLVEALKSDLGDQPDNPHVSYRMVAERDVGRELTTAEANRYWRGKALRFIADHPGRYLSLLATKAYTTWHGYRWHDVGTAHAFDARLTGRIPSFPFALLAACALCGLIVPTLERRRGLMIYALLVSQLALMLVMYVSERQRLLILPALVFLGCSTLAFLASATPKRRAAAFGAAAVLTFILSLPNHATRDDRHLWAAYDASDRAWRESIRLREAERLSEAATWAARSLAHAPWLEDFSRPARLGFAPDGFAARALAEMDSAAMEPPKRFDRAQLLIAARRPAEAEALLRRLIDAGERFDRGQIHSSEPRYFLGRALALQGRTEEATDELRQALASRPGDPFVLAELSALTGNEEYQQLISRYFGRAESLFLAGMAELKNDRSALTDLAGVVQMLPELWRARI